MVEWKPDRTDHVAAWHHAITREATVNNEASVKGKKQINTAMYRPLHSHQLSGQRMKQEFFTATTQHAL